MIERENPKRSHSCPRARCPSAPAAATATTAATAAATAAAAPTATATAAIAALAAATTATASAATAAPACCTTMASLRVLVFDHEGRPIQFDIAATAPPATADSATCSQRLTRDAAARLAIRNHLPLNECAHFEQHKTAQALYDAVVARYSSPATAALGCLLLPYLFPCYFLLVVDDYTRPSPAPREFSTDLPVLRLHSDRGGEFSFDLLRDFCRGEGIPQSSTLPASPQQNGIAERHIGLVMEVAHTSMIHAAAPHFLWPFAARYAAHQLNLYPRVSLTETSPTLRWTGKVGDSSLFRVWGSSAFVRDTSADKLSAHAIPCDVTFDEPVPFYRLFPYRSAPPPSRPLFLAPGPPLVDPLPPQGLAPSGLTQVDPLLDTVPVEVAGNSGAARGAASGGVEPGGAELGGAESEGAGSGGAEPGGAKHAGVEPGGAERRGAERRGVASSGGPAGASPRLSPQKLREWLVWRARHWSGATGAGGVGAAGAGGAGVNTGAGGTGGTVATSPAGARTKGTGASGTGGVGDAGAGDPKELGAAGAAGGARVKSTGAGGAEAGGAGAAGPGGTVRSRPYFVPLLQQVLVVPSSTSLTPPLLCPPPDHGLTERCEPVSCPVLPVRTARRVPRSRPPPVPGTHAMAIFPSSIPPPAPPKSSLRAVPDPQSDPASAAASALVVELLDFAAACRLDYATALVAKSESVSPPSDRGECALGTDVLEDRQEDFECLAAAVPRFASMLLAPEGDPNALEIPTPCSYAEAITGHYSSQWQVAMDAQMASWKSTGTYVNEVPPPGANIVDGMWIFRVKRQPGSPPAFKAHYVARGFS
ncbi:unnamed protein product [Closterium sp. NIES-54]